MTARFRLILALCLTVGALASASAQQMISRDRADAPQPVGNAMLSGAVVTDEMTPQPVKRAQISLVNAETGFVKLAYTDNAGRFAIPNLPAGRYTLSVSKAGYVRAAYGAKRPDRPGTPITLTDRQQMTGISLRMPRGGVIAGTITDETGVPAFGAQVRVLQYRVLNGERTLAPVTTSSLMGEMTDDRGAYRIFGLPAGEYIVTATPRNSGTTEIRAMTDAEIRAAMTALQQQASGQTPSGAGPAPTAPPVQPREEYQTVGYTAIYYPGATTPNGAATVTIGPGEERTGVDFAVQLVRTAKIEGSVVVPPGVAPQSVQLTLTPAATGGAPVIGLGGLGFLNRVTPGPDGKFTYTAVPPGQYTLNARANRPTGGAGAGGGQPAVAGERMQFTFTAPAGGGGAGAINPDEIMAAMGRGGGSGPGFWGMADIMVEGSPVSNVVISMQPTMTLSGAVEFKPTRGTPVPDLSRVRVSIVPAPTAGGVTIMMGGPTLQMDPAGKFTVSGVTPGRYRLSGNAAGRCRARAQGSPGPFVRRWSRAATCSTSRSTSGPARKWRTPS